MPCKGHRRIQKKAVLKKLNKAQYINQHLAAELGVSYTPDLRLVRVPFGGGPRSDRPPLPGGRTLAPRSADVVDET
jgi:hypothetical protein